MTLSALQRLQQSSPAGAALAMLAAIAARVDRVVLRALRLGLLPAADATAEADLWFSDVVARRTTSEIVLHTDSLSALREELVKSALVAAARKIVLAAHQGGPPLLLLEEELIFLGITGAEDAKIELRLGEALKTLRAEKERALDIAGWALRALPRLPATVRKTAAAWSLAFAAEGELGYAVTLGETAPDSGLDISANIPTVSLGVGRHDNVLFLGVDDGPTLSVPATTPRIVTIESGGQRIVTTIDPGRIRTIEVQAGDVVLTNLRGERWRARSTTERLPTADSDFAENGCWILVDGTDESELSVQSESLAAALGESLARAGFSLITLGRKGVSYAVADGFLHALRQQGYSSGNYRLLHLVESGSQANFQQGGRTLFPGDGESCVSAAVARADAVLSVGKSARARELADAASRAAIPLAWIGEKSNWKEFPSASYLVPPSLRLGRLRLLRNSSLGSRPYYMST